MTHGHHRRSYRHDNFSNSDYFPQNGILYIIFWNGWQYLAIKEDPQFIFFDMLDTLRPIFWGEFGVKKTMVK